MAAQTPIDHAGRRQGSVERGGVRRGYHAARPRTGVGTRPEQFYHAAGWMDMGCNAKGEIRLERRHRQRPESDEERTFRRRPHMTQSGSQRARLRHPLRARVGRSAGAVHFSKADINAGGVPPGITGRKQTNRRHCPTAAIDPKRTPPLPPAAPDPRRSSFLYLGRRLEST